MNDMFVTVPESVEEFDAAFGKAAQERDAKATIPPDAALQWRAQHRWQLEALAAIAKQVADLGDDTAAHSELESSIHRDQGGVLTFLTTTTPAYLLKVVESGYALEGSDFRSFLELLQQLPPLKD